MFIFFLRCDVCTFSLLLLRAVVGDVYFLATCGVIPVYSACRCCVLYVVNRGCLLVSQAFSDVLILRTRLLRNTNIGQAPFQGLPERARVR